MQQRRLGKSGPMVSALGFGCMGLSQAYGPGGDLQTGIKVIHKAFEEGITFFDTADVYGNGENEKFVGEAIKPFRQKLILATKCGIQRDPSSVNVNSSPEYIKQACQKSLQRLGVDSIDLYYMHRHNPSTPIEESMQAMQELIQAGKIRYVGLSEVGAETISKASKVLGDKLVALQSEYSIANHKKAEEVLPTCRKHGIAFVAFSPIARGLLTAKYHDPKVFAKDDDFRGILPQFQEDAYANNMQLVHALEEFAKAKHCTPAQLSLAWLLAQGEDIIPIPGTKRIEYLQDNLGSLKVKLSSQDLEELKKIMQNHPVKGERLPDQLMQALHMTH